MPLLWFSISVEHFAEQLTDTATSTMECKYDVMWARNSHPNTPVFYECRGNRVMLEVMCAVNLSDLSKLNLALGMQTSHEFVQSH